jgi:hypothetical protein
MAVSSGARTPTPQGRDVEEDGDEIFAPLADVRCCVLRFDNDRPVYSALVPVQRYGHTYMCCATCGASFGEAAPTTR